MEGDAWVSSELVAQDGRPDKKVYVITDRGRDELALWTSKATPVEHLRSEFAVKLRALPFGDTDAIIDDVRARRRAHEAQLAYYVDSADKFYPHPDDLADHEIGGWLVLRGGMLAEQTGIEWCDEILQRLEPEADVAER